MFVDQELKNIQEAKNRLVVCSDLRRLLMQIEVRGMWRGMFHTVSSLTLGLAVVDQLLSLLRQRRDTHR